MLSVQKKFRWYKSSDNKLISVLFISHALPEGGLFDFRNGSPHVIIWGLKFWVGEIIWSLIFLYAPKIIFSLKISGGRQRTIDFLVFEKVGLII